MTNADRLTAIQAKAEGLGLTLFEIDKDDELKREWDYGITDFGDIFICFCYNPKLVYDGSLKSINTAERLLAALSPGPVVTIRRHADGWCHTNCDLSPKYLCIHQTGHSVSGIYRPKETCPGPAPPGFEWRLVLMPKGEDDG